jgi:hypothetical protein
MFNVLKRELKKTGIVMPAGRLPEVRGDQKTGK